MCKNIIFFIQLFISHKQSCLFTSSMWKYHLYESVLCPKIKAIIQTRIHFVVLRILSLGLNMTFTHQGLWEVPLVGDLWMLFFCIFYSWCLNRTSRKHGYFLSDAVSILNMYQILILVKFFLDISLILKMVSLGTMASFLHHDLGVMGLWHGNSLSICLVKAAYIWKSRDPTMVGASCTGPSFFISNTCVKFLISKIRKHTSYFLDTLGILILYHHEWEGVFFLFSNVKLLIVNNQFCSLQC